MNLFTIPAHVPFLDAVAMEWLDRAKNSGSAQEGLILLPTRRAARSLVDAFLRVSNGKPMLLPRITALAALDETPLALSDAIELPPAVEPMQRLAALTRLILAKNGADGAPRSADKAWPLASDLAALMDEAEWAEIDLESALRDAADPPFAAHWAKTLEFLQIVTSAWPQWLADNGMTNPVARQVMLLDAQAEAWERVPPRHRVLAAGITSAAPAVARVLRAIARMPDGALVLPNLDTAASDSVWSALEPSHPQFGLRGLLHAISATRSDVRDWPVQPSACCPPGRGAVFAQALLPAAAISEWRAARTAQISAGDCIADVPSDDISGISRLRPTDEQQEALAIALVLREALETPGARAALVTPDRDLAGRVTTELRRFGVVADDSAGEPLADTPPTVFLRLIAHAVAEEFAPAALLALLKHPLTAAGLAPGACRAAARALEISRLRGPRPQPGLLGLRRAVEQAQADRTVRDLVRRLEHCLEPALRMEAAPENAPAEAIATIIESGERLAATHDASGPSRLWAGEEGEALSARLSAALCALPMLPNQRTKAIPGLLDALLEGEVVRSRRALRGLSGTEHPRIFIWGLLEARLQSVDVMVLGGLTEGVWPPRTDPGPWLSRPMRAKAGLPPPDQWVSQSAHDFVSTACAAKRLLLSAPTRKDGAPAVPARWLVRLETYLDSIGNRVPEHPAAAWARKLDLPAAGPRPVQPPRPCPPVHLRPRRLSVTEIETWLRDPYAIFARHVLRLKALRPLDEATDASDFGMVVHDGLRDFLHVHGANWPADACIRLQESFSRTLLARELRPALVAWWQPRLDRIAYWLADLETRRRAARAPAAILSECRGSWMLQRPGGEFELVGRADRIERYADGTLTIIDYKTGTLPSKTDVKAGLAPQLPLEAAMATAGAFGEAAQGVACDLAYWRLTGGYTPGEECQPFDADARALADAVKSTSDGLGNLIDQFDQPWRCYLSCPHPAHAPRFSDYAQLARVAEWASAEEENGA